MEPFSKTDAGWVDLMRVNPLLDWTYEDVWDTILALGTPYCCLYDRGYTSLGLSTNTAPNPALLLPNDKGEYAPAHTLRDSRDERSGRHL